MPAETVAAYLAALPADRRRTVETLRRVILDNLPAGYVEAFAWGMIGFEVPLAASGGTYNGKPLLYVALASQKNHVALYLNGLNCVPAARERFEAAFEAAGKTLDIGKACVRLRTLDDVDLDAIAEAVAAVPPARLVEASAAAHRKR